MIPLLALPPIVSKLTCFSRSSLYRLWSSWYFAFVDWRFTSLTIFWRELDSTGLLKLTDFYLFFCNASAKLCYCWALATTGIWLFVVGGCWKVRIMFFCCSVKVCPVIFVLFMMGMGVATNELEPCTAVSTKLFLRILPTLPFYNWMFVVALILLTSISLDLWD